MAGCPFCVMNILFLLMIYNMGLWAVFSSSDDCDLMVIGGWDREERGSYSGSPVVPLSLWFSHCLCFSRASVTCFAERGGYESYNNKH